MNNEKARMLMHSKKASTPIAIVLLVIATLVLSGFTLYTFVTKKNKIEGIVVGGVSELGEAYLIEEQINF
ncbi:MAG: hypothetical protein AABX71_03040, partial [Nanoarchaeota archaeon]